MLALNRAGWVHPNSVVARSEFVIQERARLGRLQKVRPATEVTEWSAPRPGSHIRQRPRSSQQRPRSAQRSPHSQAADASAFYQAFSAATAPAAPVSFNPSEDGVGGRSTPANFPPRDTSSHVPACSSARPQAPAGVAGSTFINAGTVGGSNSSTSANFPPRDTSHSSRPPSAHSAVATASFNATGGSAGCSEQPSPPTSYSSRTASHPPSRPPSPGAVRRDSAAGPCPPPNGNGPGTVCSTSFMLSPLKRLRDAQKQLQINTDVAEQALRDELQDWYFGPGTSVLPPAAAIPHGACEDLQEERRPLSCFNGATRRPQSAGGFGSRAAAEDEYDCGRVRDDDGEQYSQRAATMKVTPPAATNGAQPKKRPAVHLLEAAAVAAKAMR